MNKSRKSEQKVTFDAKAYINGVVTLSVFLIAGYALLPSFPKKERLRMKRSLDELAGLM